MRRIDDLVEKRKREQFPKAFEDPRIYRSKVTEFSIWQARKVLALILQKDCSPSCSQFRSDRTGMMPILLYIARYLIDMYVLEAVLFPVGYWLIIVVQMTIQSSARMKRFAPRWTPQMTSAHEASVLGKKLCISLQRHEFDKCDVFTRRHQLPTFAILPTIFAPLPLCLLPRWYRWHRHIPV